LVFDSSDNLVGNELRGFRKQIVLLNIYRKYGIVITQENFYIFRYLNPSPDLWNFPKGIPSIRL